MIETLLYCLPAVVGALALGGRYLVRRVRSAWARDVLYRVGRLAELVVLDVSREYTEAIKAASADGSLSPVERAEARRRALAKLWEHLSIETLGRALGILELAGSPESHASAALELAHHGLQQLGVVPRANPR